jgi:hypothetical protein
MHKQHIVDALKNLVPLTRPHPSSENFIRESGIYQHIDNHLVADSLQVSELIAILRNNSVLQDCLRERSIQLNPNAGRGSGDLFLPVAQWLLAQSRKRCPEEVVNQLELLVLTNTVQMREVLALWGIHPSRSIEVYPGIQLVPMSSLPPSMQKDEVTNISVYRHSVESGFGVRPITTAALVREFEHGPVLTAGQHPTEQEREEVQANVRTQLLREIARCLVLVNDSAIYPISGWYQTDETVPLVGGAHGGAGYTPLQHGHKFEPKSKDIDEAWVTSVVRDYFRLDDEVRNRLHIPLTRLNHSMMMLSKEVEDIAIDLGIALEALLTKDLDHDASISYQVRLRGTLLLGGNPETRKENYYRLKHLYNLRSKAAHGVNIGKRVKVRLGPGYPIKTVNTQKFLQEGTHMCADMIRQIIRRA